MRRGQLRGAAAALLLAACASGPAGTASPTTSTGPPPTSTTTAPPATAGPTTTTVPPEVVRTLAFGGDLLPHLPLVAAAGRYGATSGSPYDFGPMLAPLAPVLTGVDLALCHLEVPLAAAGQAITGYPSFRAPRELATAIDRAGYDGCSTASNHSLDGGRAAIDATLATFDGLGLGHTGTARTAAEAATPRIYELDGISIGHLSYAYGFNGYPLPSEAPWAANGIDLARIAADAAASRAAGARFVVVSVHWGSEYLSEPDGFQQETARALAGMADVDLVVGHHAHVVQPIERIGRTWVVYGLGNQLSNQSPPARRDGLTVRVTVAGPPGGDLEVRSIQAVPTWVDLATYEVLPVVSTLARPDLDPGRRAELDASLARTAEVVNRRGADVALA